MRVSFASQDRKLFITLPITPDDIMWGNGMNNQTFETIQHGEINLPGTRQLIAFSIDSFLPSHATIEKRYKFAQSYLEGEGIVYQFQKWRDNREPVRCVITSKSGRTLLNILVLFEHFERGMDRVSDIPFKLDVKEYRA